MDKDSFDVNERVRDFNVQLKKVVFPAPIPPVNFEFTETSSGVEGSAYTENFSYLDTSLFSDFLVKSSPTTYGVVRNIPGARTGGSVRFSETASNTAYELDVRKTAVEMMTKEMTRKIEEHCRLRSSRMFLDPTPHDDMGDSLKYCMGALFKMPVLKPMDVVMTDTGWGDITPPNALEKPEGPTQLELF